MRSIALGLLVSSLLLSPLLVSGPSVSAAGDIPCDRIPTAEGRNACYVLLAEGAKRKGVALSPLHAATSTDAQPCQPLVTYHPWFHISWTAPALMEGATPAAYILERQTNDLPAVVLAEFPPTLLSHEDTTVKAGNTYQYGLRVRYTMADGSTEASPLYMSLSTLHPPCVTVKALQPSGELSGRVK